MGCLNIKISAISEALKPTITSVTDGIKATISSAEALCCSLTANAPLAVSIGAMGVPLKVTIGEICTTPQDFYLEVSPNVVWLTPDNNFSDNFEVKSNLKWTIE